MEKNENGYPLTHTRVEKNGIMMGENHGVKCNPDRAIELRDKYPQITPAWHWNKKYWNQLDIEQLPDALVCELIDHSYDEVLKKLPRKIREKYGR